MRVATDGFVQKKLLVARGFTAMEYFTSEHWKQLSREVPCAENGSKGCSAPQSSQAAVFILATSRESGDLVKKAWCSVPR